MNCVESTQYLLLCQARLGDKYIKSLCIDLVLKSTHFEVELVKDSSPVKNILVVRVEI